MRNKRKINTFHVFYRISDNGNKNKAKLEGASKIHCLKNALDVFKNTKITIFVDAIIEETNNAIHKLCDNLENVNVKYLDCRSDPKSLRALYEDAMTLDDDDFVYFLEDDYLHLSNSFEILKEAAEMNYTDYITLYDHPDKYDYGCSNVNPYCKNFGEQTIVFRTQNHHWKITNSTTNTFGAFADVLKRDKDIMWKYTSTNLAQDFDRFIELLKNGKYLSSPIPSLSTHCENQYLAPFIDWESVVPYENTCCVAVIIHKEALDGDDEKSLKNVIEVCGKKRDIFVILPNKADTKYYEQYGNLIKIKKIADNCLNSSKSYNKTLCTKEFYELFKNYDYVLIYQTDCWVFDDRLDYFMDLNYDYYGAPWPQHNDTVGNGGFSLRKVSKMLDITSKYEYKKDSLLGNEDTWFCQTHKNELNICDLDIACNFSMEVIRDRYLEKISTIPMGLHGKEMRKYFWDSDGTKFKEFKNKVLNK